MNATDPTRAGNGTAWAKGHKWRSVCAVGSAALAATLGVGAVAGASGTAAHARHHKKASGSVTMFSISALTGTDSFEGPYAASGVYPALHTINKAGGVLGHTLNIKEIDTKSDPADALTSAEQATGTTSNVIGVQGPDSGSASTLVPFFESRHIPMISTAGQSIYDNNKRHFFWRMLPPDPANGVAMAYWAAKHDHCTRPAFVFGSDPDSQGAKPGVVLGVKHLHMKVVADVTLTPDQPSYRTQVATVLAGNPQCILTGSNGPTASTFFGEMQQLGHLVPVIPDESRENSQYWGPVMKTVGSKDFGKYFTFVAAGNPPVNPATHELDHAVHAVASKLQKPLSQWEGNPFTDNNYETYLILALAADASHSLKPAIVDAWIPRITNPGKGKVTVYTYPAALAALKAGKKIRYVGPLGPITWNKYHNFWGSEAVQKLNGKQVLRTVGVITARQISHFG